MAFKELLQSILQGGSEALRLQTDIPRHHKPDGSIITEADLAVDELLRKAVSKYYPKAGIISEESDNAGYSGTGETLFVIDPIDGTDTYSQGLPGWCIALGILDASRTPVGGIIYAPRWATFGNSETLLTLEPGKEPKLNGETLHIPPETGQSCPSQIVASSRIHRKLNLSRFPGKIRGIGSSILHLVSPLLYPGIAASVQAPCYIWDITAAHAFLLSFGFRLEYLSGGIPDYNKLLGRGKTDNFLMSGRVEAIHAVREHIDILETRKRN